MTAAYVVPAASVFPGATVLGFVVERVRFVHTTRATFARITTPTGSEVMVEVYF